MIVGSFGRFHVRSPKSPAHPPAGGPPDYRLPPRPDCVPCATSHPGVTERESHGERTWFVGGRTFVTYADHHHDDRVAFWCAALTASRSRWSDPRPDRFFRPPYVGQRGWLGVWLDVPVDWDEVAAIVADAHRWSPRRGGRDLRDEDRLEVRAPVAVEVDPAADPVDRPARRVLPERPAVTGPVAARDTRGRARSSSGRPTGCRSRSRRTNSYRPCMSARSSATHR